MLPSAYQVTATLEENHWWYRSRRDLVLAQVRESLASRGLARNATWILDFGCGTGFMLHCLAEHGQPVGADIAGDMPEVFSKAHGYETVDLRVGHRALEGRFDLVTALDVLEHVGDDLGTLSRIGSFLRPGGEVILTVPAHRWLWTGEDEISKHLRRYQGRRLLALATQSSMQVRFWSYFNLLLLPAHLTAATAFRVGPQSRRRRSLVSALPQAANEFLYRLTRMELLAIGRQRLRLPLGCSIVCRLALSPCAQPSLSPRPSDLPGLRSSGCGEREEVDVP
jgi:SAM-dependent methyltransferase